MAADLQELAAASWARPPVDLVAALVTAVTAAYPPFAERHLLSSLRLLSRGWRDAVDAAAKVLRRPWKTVDAEASRLIARCHNLLELEVRGLDMPAAAEALRGCTALERLFVGQRPSVGALRPAHSFTPRVPLAGLEGRALPLPALRQLAAHCANVAGAAPTLAVYSSLEVLDLEIRDGWPAERVAAGLAATLAGCAGLRWLALRFTSPSPPLQQCGFASAPQLESLVLEETAERITQTAVLEEVEGLEATLRCLPSLRQLSLLGLHLQLGDLDSLLDTGTRLTALSLKWGVFNRPDARHAAAVAALTSLERLALDSPPWEPLDYGALHLAGLQALTSLTLMSCRWGAGAAAPAVAAAAALRGLRSLEAQLWELGRGALAALPPSLTRLRLLLAAGGLAVAPAELAHLTSLAELAVASPLSSQPAQPVCCGLGSGEGGPAPLALPALRSAVIEREAGLAAAVLSGAAAGGGRLASLHLAHVALPAADERLWATLGQLSGLQELHLAHVALPFAPPSWARRVAPATRRAGSLPEPGAGRASGGDGAVGGASGAAPPPGSPRDDSGRRGPQPEPDALVDRLAALLSQLPALHTLAVYDRRLDHARSGTVGMADANPFASRLALKIVKENFGDICHSAAAALVNHGTQTWAELVRVAGLPPAQLRLAMQVLLQHSFVNCYLQVEPPTLRGPGPSYHLYAIDVHRVVQSLRQPRFLIMVRDELDENAEGVVSRLMEHGRLRLERLKQVASEAQEEEEEEDDDKEEDGGRDEGAVAATLAALIKARFIERPKVGAKARKKKEVKPGSEEEAQLLREQADAQQRQAYLAGEKGLGNRGRRGRCCCPGCQERFKLPPDFFASAGEQAANDAPAPGGKRKRGKAAAGEDPPAKRGRKKAVATAAAAAGAGPSAEGGEELCSADILWRVNYEEFNRRRGRKLRNEAIVQFVCSKNGSDAGAVVAGLLKANARLEAGLTDGRTAVLSVADVKSAIRQLRDVEEPEHVAAALEDLAQDELNFLEAQGTGPGGKQYALDVSVLLSMARLIQLKATIRGRFGDKGMRVWSLLLESRQLEQKQIADMAMLPKEEARELLYAMLRAGYVQLQDVPRTADHAPSRTFYTWRAALDPAVARLTADVYKGAGNLYARIAHEGQQNKQLLELWALVVKGEVGASSLQEEEKQKLQRVIRTLQLLECGLLECDRDLCVFDA
eukprot:scaffold4.g4674.t1